MGKKYYYAVANGRQTGVFNDWDSCKSQVQSYSGASFKKFSSAADAAAFASGGNSSGDSRSGNSNNSNNSNSSNNSNNSSSYGQNGGFRLGYNNYYNSQKSSKVSKPFSTSKTSRSSSSIGLICGASSSYGSSSSSPPLKTVYCDGASRNNGKPHAKAGYGVYFGEGDPRNTASPLEGSVQTNQRAELTAIKHGTDVILKELEAARSSSALQNRYEIKTDSQYSKKALTEWNKTWEKNGWKNSAGAPVANSDLIKPTLDNIKRINQNLERLNVKEKFNIGYVPGHSGDYGNDRADDLANRGVDQNFR